MNHVVREMLSFDLMMGRHPLSRSAQLLWYSLLIRTYFNKGMFRGSDKTVSKLLGCSTRTMLAARQALIDAGLLEFAPGEKGRPGAYRLLEVPPPPIEGC